MLPLLNNSSGLLWIYIAKIRFVSRKEKCISQLFQLQTPEEHPAVQDHCMNTCQNEGAVWGWVWDAWRKARNSALCRIVPLPFCERDKILSWQSYFGMRELRFPTQIHLSNIWACCYGQARSRWLAPGSSILHCVARTPFWFHWQFCLHPNIRSILKATNNQALYALWITLSFTFVSPDDIETFQEVSIKWPVLAEMLIAMLKWSSLVSIANCHWRKDGLIRRNIQIVYFSSPLMSFCVFFHSSH